MKRRSVLRILISAPIVTHEVFKMHTEPNIDNTNTAGYGQIWVSSKMPNKLYFTDDFGKDYFVDEFI